MPYLFQPIFLFITAAIFYLAFCKHAHNQYVFAIALLVLGGATLRVYTNLDPYLHDWDERYHALIAKHLVSHPLLPTLYENPVLPYDYTNWTANHIWLHKQPLTLWLMAFSIKLLGCSVYAIRLPSLFMSLIGIKLVYDVASFYFDRKTAFLTAFLFSTHGLIIELAAGGAATDHTDISFLFFILLSIWCGVRYIITQRTIFTLYTGISLGCALLSKWLPAFIVIVVLLPLMHKKESYKNTIKQCAVITLSAIIVFLPWQLYILSVFPAEAAYEYRAIYNHISHGYEGNTGGLLYHFDMLRMVYGELIYIPLIWFTYTSIKQRPDSKRISLLLWFWGIYLFFSFAATKMQAYTLPAAPVVFMITAYAFYQFLAYASQKQIIYKRFVQFICIALLALPLRYSIERIKPFENHLEIPGWMASINELKQSPHNTPKTVIFNSQHPIETMFHTQCIAYSHIPDSATITTLTLKGYSIKILD
jgi:4-amino-4-deoxy-L-arabinose transferase